MRLNRENIRHILHGAYAGVIGTIYLQLAFGERMPPWWGWAWFAVIAIVTVVVIEVVTRVMDGVVAGLHFVIRDHHIMDKPGVGQMIVCAPRLWVRRPRAHVSFRPDEPGAIWIDVPALLDGDELVASRMLDACTAGEALAILRQAMRCRCKDQPEQCFQQADDLTTGLCGYCSMNAGGVHGHLMDPRFA